MICCIRCTPIGHAELSYITLLTSIMDFTISFYWIFSVSSDSTKTGATSGKADLLPSGQKKLHSSMRILKGHSGAITALHCVTRREVWDLVGDREDAGFFISGSTDCLVGFETNLHLFSIHILYFLFFCP